MLSVAAAPFAQAINNVSTNIVIGGLNFGTLSLTNLGAHNNGVRGGVEIDGTFLGNYPPLGANVEARWVQLVNTSHPINTTNAPGTPYFDPGEQDLTGDFDPFYWNTPLQARDGISWGQFWYRTYQFNDGQGISFYDRPSRLLSGAPVSWEAELNLVCWEPGTQFFGVLWSGSYGFTIDTGGNVTASGITPGSLGYLNQDVLSEMFPGWDMNKPIVPEPGPMILVAFGALAALAVARRRFHP